MIILSIIIGYLTVASIYGYLSYKQVYKYMVERHVLRRRNNTWRDIEEKIGSPPILASNSNYFDSTDLTQIILAAIFWFISLPIEIAYNVHLRLKKIFNLNIDDKFVKDVEARTAALDLTEKVDHYEKLLQDLDNLIDTPNINNDSYIKGAVDAENYIKQGKTIDDLFKLIRK